MYVCGVTPYDTTHLGHARTFLVFDVLARALEAGGTRVRYAQNVTDVDESILQRAARDGVDWRELGRRDARDPDDAAAHRPAHPARRCLRRRRKRLLRHRPRPALWRALGTQPSGDAADPRAAGRRPPRRSTAAGSARLRALA